LLGVALLVVCALVITRMPDPVPPAA
jgi:hypothetical protein